MLREPRLLRRRRPQLGPDERLVLGLDLGTTTGYAYAVVDPGGPIDPTQVQLHLGNLDLSLGEYDSGATRFVRLRKYLAAIEPDLVVFERVRNTPVAGKFPRPTVSLISARVTPAAQFFGALSGTLAAWCERREVPCCGIEIGAIKKRATGRGNASKEDMIRAANKLFGTDFDPATYEQTGVDNICDAAFCLLVGLEELAGGLQGAEGVQPAGRPGRAAADAR